MSKALLKPSSILLVPMQTYEKDFSFIVNGEEFKTSRLLSDLLSPTICKIHSNDPTIDSFVINTKHCGNFSRFLQLANFEPTPLLETDLPFFSEVIEILGNESIELQSSDDTTEITVDNVLNLLKIHEKYQHFYCNHISREIEFASSHFYELLDSHKEDLGKLSILTLSSILHNDQLRLKNEDQLLSFVNELYSNHLDNSKKTEYSILYETVLYSNVSSELMNYFVSVYNASEMTMGTWNALSNRLCKKVTETESSKNQEGFRYCDHKEDSKDKIFEYSESKVMNGIINHLRTQSGGQIEKEINFTASSINDSSFEPINASMFDDRSKIFESQNRTNSWICFDFKDRRVTPTHYTVRSANVYTNWFHPKSWVIEGSIDGSSWEEIDEENNCSHLNGGRKTHTFVMNHPTNKEFRYIRMKSTGPDWNGSYYLIIEAFEIYGRII